VTSADHSSDSRELASLIHHVELNKSGWLDRAIDRLVIAALWLVEPATIEEVMEFLYHGFDGRVTSERIKSILESEAHASRVVQLPGEKFKVSETAAIEFRAELDSAVSAESALQARFHELASDIGIEANSNELWSDFQSMFIEPLVSLLGATLYELITVSDVRTSNFQSYRHVADNICSKYGLEAQDLIMNFLDPLDPRIRSFVLAHLNVRYLKEGIALDPQVIRKLDEARGRPDEARIFLDTNFVFSFLGLRDNPGNELAAELLQLVETTRSSIKVTLYVLPETIAEARRALGRVASQLTGIRATGNLAEAASQLRSQGLLVGFLKAASASPGLTAVDYFGRYEDNLVTILRENGVELFNSDLSELHVDQAVIDDIYDLEDRQIARFGSAKPYEANLHDMVLWHFVERRRPQSMDSPIDAGNWVCTLDMGLIAFDRRKRESLKSPLVCILPAGLIQLMQFWVPRTVDLDTALVGSMRQPLMLLQFDIESENTTVRILRSLSRIRGVERLSLESSLRVLTNDALRSRVELTTTESQMLELVESAISDELVQLQERVAQLESSDDATSSEENKARLQVAEEEARRMRLLAATARSEAETTKAKIVELEDYVEEVRRSEETTRSSIETERDALRERVQILEDSQSTAVENTRILRIGISTALLVILAGLSSYLIPVMLARVWHFWVRTALGIVTAVILISFAAEQYVKRYAGYKTSRMYRTVRYLRNWLIAGLVAISLSVIAALIVNSFSNHPK